MPTLQALQGVKGILGARQCSRGSRMMRVGFTRASSRIQQQGSFSSRGFGLEFEGLGLGSRVCQGSGLAWV